LSTKEKALSDGDKIALGRSETEKKIGEGLALGEAHPASDRK
jgi:hypothetical protein